MNENIIIYSTRYHLKGQSHEKVARRGVWAVSLGQNKELLGSVAQNLWAPRIFKEKNKFVKNFEK
jgi:hypothetical protein